MVAPIVAAAAPAVIDSATKEDGLVNQAFKITILIGLALVIGMSLFIAWKLIPALSNLFTTIGNAAGAVSSSIGVIGTIGTFILSATPLGRGLRIFRSFRS